MYHIDIHLVEAESHPCASIRHLVLMLEMLHIQNMLVPP